MEYAYGITEGSNANDILASARSEVNSHRASVRGKLTISWAIDIQQHPGSPGSCVLFLFVGTCAPHFRDSQRLGQISYCGDCVHLQDLFRAETCIAETFFLRRLGTGK